MIAKRRIFYSESPTRRAVREVAYDQLREEVALRQFERKQRADRVERRWWVFAALSGAGLLVYIVFG